MKWILVGFIARASSLTMQWKGESSSKYDQDGAMFVSNFLPRQNFEHLQRECRQLRSKFKPEKNSIAVERVGVVMDSRSFSHGFLTSQPTIETINGIVQAPVPLTASSFPVEVRLYTAGAGMAWHQDDQLFEQPQCELVLTVTNDSDSETEWIDARGICRSEWTRPNSALLVKAGEQGALHRATTLHRGERMIIKAVYVEQGSSPTDKFWSNLDSFPGLRERMRPVRPGGKGKLKKGHKTRHSL